MMPPTIAAPKPVAIVRMPLISENRAETAVMPIVTHMAICSIVPDEPPGCPAPYAPAGWPNGGCWPKPG